MCYRCSHLFPVLLVWSKARRSPKEVLGMCKAHPLQRLCLLSPPFTFLPGRVVTASGPVPGKFLQKCLQPFRLDFAVGCLSNISVQIVLHCICENNFGHLCALSDRKILCCVSLHTECSSTNDDLRCPLPILATSPSRNVMSVTMLAIAFSFIAGTFGPIMKFCITFKSAKATITMKYLP